eukprot:CAMPEP_0116877222 /NCGR_PEP_ID=MMETSP0463-20121206/9029_1 /TAXON_ID=181622 /ORGANISM="Strombidinopsis sp, Strain SopsisLIS2011" /LENGTH=35 /DNA_ID= /DNA_START= /DNA_END= /DNA_ORIENTATION=
MISPGHNQTKNHFKAASSIVYNDFGSVKYDNSEFD